MASLHPIHKPSINPIAPSGIIVQVLASTNLIEVGLEDSSSAMLKSVGVQFFLFVVARFSH
jgi:hypothetical protein